MKQELYILSSDTQSFPESTICTGCRKNPENEAYAWDMAYESGDVTPDVEFMLYDDDENCYCCICGYPGCDLDALLSVYPVTLTEDMYNYLRTCSKAEVLYYFATSSAKNELS